MDKCWHLVGNTPFSERFHIWFATLIISNVLNTKSEIQKHVVILKDQSCGEEASHGEQHLLGNPTSKYPARTKQPMLKNT